MLLIVSMELLSLLSSCLKITFLILTITEETISILKMRFRHNKIICLSKITYHIVTVMV